MLKTNKKIGAYSASTTKKRLITKGRSYTTESLKQKKAKTQKDSQNHQKRRGGKLPTHKKSSYTF